MIITDTPVRFMPYKENTCRFAVCTNNEHFNYTAANCNFDSMSHQILPQKLKTQQLFISIYQYTESSNEVKLQLGFCIIGNIILQITFQCNYMYVYTACSLFIRLLNLTVIYIICSLSLSVAPTLTFDGGQYMKVVFPEESVTEVEDISLRFRTERESGLLLVTSSQKSSDNLLMYLDRGKLKLEISISNKREVRMPHCFNYPKLGWFNEEFICF